MDPVYNRVIDYLKNSETYLLIQCESYSTTSLEPDVFLQVFDHYEDLEKQIVNTYGQLLESNCQFEIGLTDFNRKLRDFSNSRKLEIKGIFEPSNQISLPIVLTWTWMKISDLRSTPQNLSSYLFYSD